MTYNQQNKKYQISLVKNGKVLMTSSIFTDSESYNSIMAQLNTPGCYYNVNCMTYFPVLNNTHNLDSTHNSYGMSTSKSPDAFKSPSTDSYGMSTSTSPTSIWGNGLDILAGVALGQIKIFDNMTLEEVHFIDFNGYLLIPPEGHEDHGKLNLHGSIWNNNMEGWLVAEENLDFFLDNGAMWKLENERIDDIINDKKTNIFDDMIFEEYDNKYLVQCYDDHISYKKNNYYGGTWNQQGDGWLFGKDMKKFLEDNGAKYEDNSNVVFDNMVYSPSRSRGFKLIPEEDNKFYGLDNFLGKGLWRNTYWFFPSTNHNYFISGGAELLTYQ